MTYNLSIIANPKGEGVDPKIITAIAKKTGGAVVGLAPGLAYIIRDINADEEAGRDARIKANLSAADANLLTQIIGPKRLLIADMDSTIIEQECIAEIAEYAGKRAQISDITERAMRGELDFEASLKERVAMLKGLPESVLQETFDKRISLTPGAKKLVQTMKKHGAVTALVSGGFTFFTQRVAAACGFQINQANELIVENGVLTGEVKMPVLGRQAKEDALRRIAAENDIDLSQTIAVGDGANDLSMLGAAGLGVAFRAKPAVAEMADARIDHGDLTALLFLQGISKSEFAD